MNKLTDTFILSNGVKVPCVGYGTYLTPDGEIAKNSVIRALHAGYRHIDTAFAYGNESAVGAGIKESGVKREDIFVAFLRGETNNWAGSYLARTEPLFAFYPEREIYTSRYGQNLQILLPLVYQKPCGFLDVPLMNYIHQGESLSQTMDSLQAAIRI